MKTGNVTHKESLLGLMPASLLDHWSLLGRVASEMHYTPLPIFIFCSILLPWYLIPCVYYPSKMRAPSLVSLFHLHFLDLIFPMGLNACSYHQKPNS